MVDNNKRVSRTGLSLISPDPRTSPPVSTCTSVPGEDERLDAAFAGPRFLLPKAGVDLHAFGPDLIALAGCGGSGGGMPGIALGPHRGRWVGSEISWRRHSRAR